MTKFKLAYQLVEKAEELKRQRLNDCDITAAIGVCKQTFSKWINHSDAKVQMGTYRRELGMMSTGRQRSFDRCR